MQSYEIAIVGAGPAGTSTALQLAALDPDLAGRVLLLDKATFPRHKLCAGGVTNSVDKILAQMGVNIESPNIPIHTSKFILPTGVLTLEQESHFKICRRDEFDHQLFRAAKERGVIGRDGEAVEGVILDSERVIIRTSKNEYSSKILIGADGANSTVRRLLGLSRASRVMMAIEIFAPAVQVLSPNLTHNTAVFDFTVKSKGIPGYCWIFPAIDKTLPMVSLGIIQSSNNRRRGVSLKSAFEHWLAGTMSNGNHLKLQAHPAIRYEPRAVCSQYRTLLVGDAAGIDSLFGEGITSALALGMLAAQSSYEALRSNDFSFSDYEQRVRSSLVGKMMRRRRTVARRFYNGYALERRSLQMANLLDWITPMSSREVLSTVTWAPSSSYSEPFG
jgi:geranylgeranyl reductase family protein